MSNIKRLRTQKITIDLPRTDSEPWIHITIQQVETDEYGNDVNVVDRVGQISKRLSEVAQEVINYEDIIPPNGVNMISVYGMSSAITAMAVKWIAEKYNGRVDEHGYIVIGE